MPLSGNAIGEGHAVQSRGGKGLKAALNLKVGVKHGMG